MAIISLDKFAFRIHQKKDKVSVEQKSYLGNQRVQFAKVAHIARTQSKQVNLNK